VLRAAFSACGVLRAVSACCVRLSFGVLRAAPDVNAARAAYRNKLGMQRGTAWRKCRKCTVVEPGWSGLRAAA
jgi:hypothetical protein